MTKSDQYRAIQMCISDVQQTGCIIKHKNQNPLETIVLTSVHTLKQG